MNRNAIEKRTRGAIKEKAQYAGAFGIIGVMLWVAGFPVFLLFFVGVLSFFIWKVFSSEGRNETRRVFEFYLTANEILREDDRRWYGFEIQEAIAKGEAIVRSMSAAPPLVSFGLGALYQKLDDHSSAVKYLSQVVEENAVNETAIVYPSKELREYVRMLRKIERAPVEAPLTSSAIRSLERARKNRGKKLLEESRLELTKRVVPLEPKEQKLESIVDQPDDEKVEMNGFEPRIKEMPERVQTVPPSFTQTVRSSLKDKPTEPPTDRKTISEVLHDIYDQNVQ
ncbi:MAG: hypothetical protein ABL999_02410 [Pyrinomonadaceae bacterium]